MSVDPEVLRIVERIRLRGRPIEPLSRHLTYDLSDEEAAAAIEEFAARRRGPRRWKCVRRGVTFVEVGRGPARIDGEPRDGYIVVVAWSSGDRLSVYGPPAAYPWGSIEAAVVTAMARLRMSSARPATGTEMIVYRAEADGTLWARAADEFDDGRFTEVPAGVAG